ncbi:MAG: HlyD family efflux transporter periplasmic adaptor subunit [Planctomycetaceae bacterium]
MAKTPLNGELVARLRSVHTSLRPDLEISRHVFHGDAYYVVRDPITFHSHNVAARDYHVLIRLKATLSLGDTFEMLVAEGILARDQEEQFFRFVLTLQQLGFLRLPVADGSALYARYERRQAAGRRQKLMGLLFYRVPLLNPDAFLGRTVQYARPLFTRGAFALWLMLMLAAAIVLANRWHDFLSPAEPVFVARNAATLWFLLIGLKALHEFGHAYSCKVFGGKVPEMGAYFILLTPCAYVDASTAWGFPSRKHRIIVSLAGMYVESVIAACAVFVWAWTASSFVHSCAHQVVILAGILTLALNINPLMRFDGYYVLSDLMNVPNLRSRSYALVSAIAKRLFLGIRRQRSAHGRSIDVQLAIYGIAALQYKVLLVLAICTVIALRFGMIGLVVSAVYLFGVLLTLVRQLTRYLWTSPETAAVRKRAIAWSVVLVMAVPTAVLSIPATKTQHMTGVVGGEKEARLNAAVSGFLTAESIKPGADVAANDVLCRLENTELSGNTNSAAAELELYELQTRIEQMKSPDGASPSQRRLEHARVAFEQAKLDRDGLTIRAPYAGTLLNVSHDGQPGSFIREGEHIATVAGGDWVVRSLATAEDIADMQARVGKPVRVRLRADTSAELEGTITRISKMGTKETTSQALTQLFGGEIPVSPRNGEMDQPYFEIVVHIDGDDQLPLRHGMTARVCYETTREAYGRRLMRKYRQFVNKLLVM